MNHFFIRQFMSDIWLCGFLESLYAHRQGIAYRAVQIESD